MTQITHRNSIWVNYINRLPLQSNLVLAEEMKKQLIQACKRIELTGDELEKVIQKDPDANSGVKATARYLFDKNDLANVAFGFKQLHKICNIQISDKENDRTMDLEGDQMSKEWRKAWEKIRLNKYDIVSY